MTDALGPFVKLHGEHDCVVDGCRYDFYGRYCSTGEPFAWEARVFRGDHRFGRTDMLTSPDALVEFKGELMPGYWSIEHIRATVGNAIDEWMRSQ